jgi:hypothetical protein
MSPIHNQGFDECPSFKHAAAGRVDVPEASGGTIPLLDMMGPRRGIVGHDVETKRSLGDVSGIRADSHGDRNTDKTGRQRRRDRSSQRGRHRGCGRLMSRRLAQVGEGKMDKVSYCSHVQPFFGSPYSQASEEQRK